MDNISIKEKLVSMIQENIEENIEVMGNTNLFDDLGFDSIMMINLIVDIENEWNIELDDDDLDFEELSSFEKLSSVVIDKVSRMG